MSTIMEHLDIQPLFHACAEIAFTKEQSYLTNFVKTLQLKLRKQKSADSETSESDVIFAAREFPSALGVNKAER